MGKTYTTLKLINKLQKMGYKVGAFKPIETGVVDIPSDGLKLYQAIDNKNLSLDDIVPIQLQLPASPIVAGNVDFKKIDKAYNKLKQKFDILLIEGAGGIKVPITTNFYMYDFIDYFGAKSLLVVGSALGCINDLELNLSFFEPTIWAINVFDDDFYTISYPYFKTKYKNVLTIQKNLDTIIEKLLKG
jgi:dethiobiotin synthetase